MLDKEIRRALDTVRLTDPETDALWLRIDQALQAPPEKEVTPMPNKRLRISLRVALIAALLAGLFAVGAYAGGFLGSRAIVIPEETPAASASPTTRPGKAGPVPTEAVGEKAAAQVSLTQPQAVPEEMDPAIREKVDKAARAWSEWTAWQEGRVPPLPESLRAPGSCILDIADEPAPDGTYHAVFYRTDPEDPDKQIVLKESDATAEELAQFEAHWRYVSAADYQGDLDFNYHVHDGEEEQKLLEIADRYGLRLRRALTLLWSKETVEAMDREMNEAQGTDLHTDTSSDRFLTNRGLIDRLEQVGCCGGSLFYETPWGFDKVYYFDEGTFCVSWYALLPSTGERVTCYGYNSMYDTLSSGREVITFVADPDAFDIRTHRAPDGTEVTILRQGNDAFFYVYLPNSFFEVHVGPAEALTDADLDAIADSVRYSVIAP